MQRALLLYVYVRVLRDSKILKYVPASIMCNLFGVQFDCGQWTFSFSFSFLQAESLEDKNMTKVHLCQLEKLKSQYDRLTEELTHNENENKKLKLKYQSLKDQLEEKVKV